jgi:hypothetical protein
MCYKNVDQEILMHRRVLMNDKAAMGPQMAMAAGVVVEKAAMPLNEVQIRKELPETWIHLSIDDIGLVPQRVFLFVFHSLLHILKLFRTKCENCVS